MSQHEGNVLVPIDFEEQSLVGLRQSYLYARHENASISLLYVIEDPKDDVQAAKDRLDKLANDVKVESGIKTNTIISKGNPFVEISKVAKDINASMIIMGFNSSMGLRKIIGPNAFQLVREAPCAVLTMKGRQPHRDKVETIILPLDLSKESREKVAPAVEYAKHFGATIRIAATLTSNDEFKENRIIAYANQAKTFIKENGVRCGNKTLRGRNVAKMIVDYATETNADLILIVNQEELGFAEVFTGSEQQQIVNLSKIPVLTIRPKPRKDTSTFTNPF
jgi:nucleotide-binding universal stress UspA family protein